MFVLANHGLCDVLAGQSSFLEAGGRVHGREQDHRKADQQDPSQSSCHHSCLGIKFVLFQHDLAKRRGLPGVPWLTALSRESHHLKTASCHRSNESPLWLTNPRGFFMWAYRLIEVYFALCWMPQHLKTKISCCWRSSYTTSCSWYACFIPSFVLCIVP